MKLQLDTTNKTIKLESNVKISALLETLKKLFPNNEWKEFSLETNVTINNWNTPIVIQKEIPWRQYPWYYGENKINTIMCKGNYNVEC